MIIMDEPTANLNQDELDAFFSMIEELKRKHVTIIYVSHRLREIFQLADRVSVLPTDVSSRPCLSLTARNKSLLV